MKPHQVVAACAATLASASASTVITAPPIETGIPYRHTITMDGTDSASVSRHVGAWSWEDNALFNAANGEPPVGWTHTSDWVALTLLTATQFTLRLERQEGVPFPTSENPANFAGITSMFPSFTIYSGWDGDGDQVHMYTNRGNVSWAEDITYLDHLDNSTLPSASRSWLLPAGNYTIALGSNAPATDTNRQGYLATLTTIPEPGSAALAAACVAVFFQQRRRPRHLPPRTL